MVKLTKIYTRTGDQGSTALLGGARIDKTDTRVILIGAVDELNSHCGLVAAAMQADYRLSELSGTITRIQNQLFDCGAQLAATKPSAQIPHLTDRDVANLEHEIDEMNDLLEPLSSFILPGGSEVVARIHVARAVCRRVELIAWQLAERDTVPEVILRYLNRLSDWFFVLARVVGKTRGEQEVLWKIKR